MRMWSYSRAGLTFDVREHGGEGGEAVLLLHGWPQDAETYDEIARSLAAAGYRTLAPYQRGYSPGARPRSPRDYVMREIVADNLALLDAADVERAHVVGHDWGGAVAWSLAGRFPERTRTLTALSTPHPSAMGAAMRSSTQALRSSYMLFFQLPWLPELLATPGNGAGLRRALHAMGCPEPHASRYAAAMARPGALSASLNWYRAIPYAMQHRRGRAASAGARPAIRTPTLYVYGAHDPAFTRAAADGTAAYVDAPYRYEVLEDASHWLPEASAAEVSGLLLEHLRGAG